MQRLQRGGIAGAGMREQEAAKSRCMVWHLRRACHFTDVPNLTVTKNSSGGCFLLGKKSSPFGHFC